MKKQLLKFQEFITENKSSMTEEEFREYMKKYLSGRGYADDDKEWQSFKDINKAEEIIDAFGFDQEVYSSDEEALEDLRSKLSVWKKMADPVRLYRAISVESQSQITEDNLGEHWTLYPFFDYDLLGSIGSDEWEDEKEIWIIEADVPLSEIDIKQTILQNLSYPNENEINLKNGGRGVEVVRKYKLDQ